MAMTIRLAGFASITYLDFKRVMTDSSELASTEKNERPTLFRYYHCYILYIYIGSERS